MERTQPSCKTFLCLYFSLCPKLFEVSFNLHYVNRYVAKGCEELTIRCQISITLSLAIKKKRQCIHGWKESTILQLCLYLQSSLCQEMCGARGCEEEHIDLYVPQNSSFCWLLELKMSIDAFDILIDLEFDGKKAQGGFNDQLMIAQGFLMEVLVLGPLIKLPLFPSIFYEFGGQ